MKIALVHDYLKEYGGAEKVLEALHEIYPEAPIFVAFYDPKGLGTAASRFKSWDIRTSFIQRLPFAKKLLSPYRIFAPLAFESFDLSEYDLVISSSAAYFAKAVITKPETLHISYIHTPPRYLYGYATSFNYKKNPLTNLLAELANHFLRIWDFEVSQRPDILVANSKNVKDRIKKFYRREAVVIYPPVEMGKIKDQSTSRWTKTKTGNPDSKKYYLSLGRLVRGKRTEVIIQTCTKLNLPLKVVGNGPELTSLQKIAGPTVEFLGMIDDEEITGLYAGAKATIVASEDEDFGIVPVESMAAGTPVIAPKSGGFQETIIEGKTGQFFGQGTKEELITVLQSFDYTKYRPETCREQASKFSKEEFIKSINQLIAANFKGQLPKKGKK